jgi:predicted dehydrogenase
MLNRRGFLAAGAAGLFAGRAPAASGWFDQPKRVGLIGAGWYGKCDLFRLLQVAPVEVVSVCDVDSAMLADAAEQIAGRQKSKAKPRPYADYRKMLAEKDLDLCLIATPDHWHALPAIAAMEAGCDLYLQKPISIDVAEGKAILDTARRLNRVVQVGTQRRSTPHLIEARDNIIKAGKLGAIGHVEICCYYHMRNPSNPPDEAPPANLDWEMYVGPAPFLPYNRIAHPRGWRAFTEFGNGIVGDMCIHMLDTVRWLLDLGWPTRVSSTGGINVQKQAKANISDTQIATFDFPSFPVVWTHRTWGSTPDQKYPWGLTIYGEKGTLKASVMSYDFIPNQGPPIHRDVAYELDQYPEDRTEKDLEKHVAPAIRGHMNDLLRCVRDRAKPVADVEQGHISTAACLLANLSASLGRTLAYDPAKHLVVGDDQATALLKRPYRAPWTHPAG